MRRSVRSALPFSSVAYSSPRRWLILLSVSMARAFSYPFVAAGTVYWFCYRLIVRFSQLLRSGRYVASVFRSTGGVMGVAMFSTFAKAFCISSLSISGSIYIASCCSLDRMSLLLILIMSFYR